MDLVAQIRALNKIGIALSSETNPQNLMELILEEARRLTNADGGSLYLKEGNSLTFYVTQNRTLSDRSAFGGGFKHHSLPISKDSFAGFVATTGEALRIEDAYNLPDGAEYSFNYDFDKKNDYRTRSVLVIPLKTPEGEVFGVLQLINATDSGGTVVSFSEEIVPLASSLASQAVVALRNARLIHDIKNLLKSIVQFSASAIDARSPYTAGHSYRVAEYSRAIAEAINLDKSGAYGDVFFASEQLEELYYAAMLHDIGKIGIPESVLDKQTRVSEVALSSIKTRFELAKTLEITRLPHSGPAAAEDPEGVESQRGEIEERFRQDFAFINRINRCSSLADTDLERLTSLADRHFTDIEGRTHPLLKGDEIEALTARRGNLTDEEYKKIQSHVVHTQRIVEKIPFPDFLKNVPRYASSHHEKIDGSGYPSGLRNEELPLQARILAVADIFDALTAADRPYSENVSIDEALELLHTEAETGALDKNLVTLFIEKRLYTTVAPGMRSDYFP